MRLFYFIVNNVISFIRLSNYCSCKRCLSLLEIVLKLKTNLYLHCCYLDSLLFSVLVIVRLFFLVLSCIYLKIFIISLQFCLSMGLTLP